MTGVYTASRDAYNVESIFGTSSIPNATIQTYSYGSVNKESYWPSPVTTVNTGSPSLSKMEPNAGDTWKNAMLLEGMLGVGAQNAILIQSVMGKSTTTGPVGEIYTHTIAPHDTPVDGALPLLPSYTLHHEATGTASDWVTQFTGTKVTSLGLTCGFEQRILIYKTKWVAQKPTKMAFVLDDDPILPATANEAPYYFTNMSRTFDGVAVDGLKYMELSLIAGLMPEYSQSWLAGVDTSRWPKSFAESPTKKYILRLQYSPHSSAIWEELIKFDHTTPDWQPEVVFKWSRSTDDYIQVTCADCHVIGHPVVTPEHGKELLVEALLEPRAVSIEVKDKLAGSWYGE